MTTSTRETTTRAWIYGVRMTQFVLKIEKLSHIMGPRGSQDFSEVCIKKVTSSLAAIQRLGHCKRLQTTVKWSIVPGIVYFLSLLFQSEVLENVDTEVQTVDKQFTGGAFNTCLLHSLVQILATRNQGFSIISGFYIMRRANSKRFPFSATGSQKPKNIKIWN